MALIILSFITGFLGLSIGSRGGESLMILLGIAGFLVPGLYILQQIYNELRQR
ncbi:MAG: hypothetical protein AB2417_07030 [Clostridiaceae bacterium]